MSLPKKKSGYSERLWKNVKESIISMISKAELKYAKLMKLDASKLSAPINPLNLSKAGIRKIKLNLSLLLKQETDPQTITAQEKQIIDQIHDRTMTANRNNITRTQAYYDLYKEYPELHWAFLAHMVSRNGGWNMTDLKGDLLPRLMTQEQTKHLFLLLERANFLIFQDAYPQLLLYTEGLKLNRNLFHLLKKLNVSIWMKAVWDYYWKDRDSTLLTIALIVNEQNYIEDRVVQHPEFKKHVLDTLLFKTQSLLQMNQVVFPYHSNRQSHPTKLAGLILEDFSDLHERIEFGKKLYSLLYSYPEVFEGAVGFAERMKHSGSRADYWPHLYTKIKVSIRTFNSTISPSSNSKASAVYAEKLNHCHLKDGASPFYSPELTTVWKDQSYIPPQEYDWCKDSSALSFFNKLIPPATFEITNEHCSSLNKVELAVKAKGKI